MRQGEALLVVVSFLGVLVVVVVLEVNEIAPSEILRNFLGELLIMRPRIANLLLDFAVIGLLHLVKVLILEIE